MDRRDVLAAVVGTTVGAVVAPTTVFARPVDVPPELADYFAASLAGHAERNMCLGSGPVLPSVVTEAATLRQALEVAPAASRRDLLALSFGYSDFIGWLHQDLGDLAEAWRWRTEALTLAYRSGDPNLIGYALARLAFTHLDDGDTAAAGDLARSALATPGLAGAARSYAGRMAAHAAALGGDRDSVDRLLDGAHRDADQPPAATGWVDVTTTESHQATCYGRLAAPEAPELLQRARGRYRADAHRAQGVLAAREAAALLALDGPQAALDPATDAVERLGRASSPRTASELVGLRDAAGQRVDEHGGRDLIELLAEV